MMRLLFKQRFFSWFDSYDIYDEDGNTVYVVKGELSWGHRLQIYDAYGNHLGTVQEKVLTWLPKFELYVGNRQVGVLEKEFTFFRPKFNLDCNGWTVEGDFSPTASLISRKEGGYPCSWVYWTRKSYICCCFCVKLAIEGLLSRRQPFRGRF